MNFDIGKVLDCIGEVSVVQTDVDLSSVKYRGEHLLKSPINMEVKAENKAGIVTLRIKYCYTLFLTCDRCLTPYTQDIVKNEEHIVIRKLNDNDNDEILEAPDGTVNLDELATNDIITDLPDKFLCKEDCKGLCPKCGRNLNDGNCNCDLRETDPRLAALDKFFEND